MITRRRGSLLALLLFIGLLSSPCNALEVPDKPEGYISDYAMLFTPVAVLQLNKDLYQFEKESSNQIAVATFESLEGENLEDFSIMLAEKWKIGNKDSDNGVTLLIFEKDRKIRIEVGYGLEGALTDATSKSIINQIIVPSFRKREFDQGIFRAVEAIISATKGEYKPVNTTQKQKLSGNALFVVMLLFFIMPLFSYLVIFLLCMSYFGFVPGLLMSLLLITLLSFIRGGFFNTTYGTPIGGRRRFFTGGYYGGGYGGGFGGGSFSGGGGSFGGGGASGSW